jgi:hypothetical protein
MCDKRIAKFDSLQVLIQLIFSYSGQSYPCVVHILSPGDALLMPEPGERTAIAFDTTPQGVIVSTVEGRIRIVSTRSNDWLKLSAGETFIARTGGKGTSAEWRESSELCSDVLQEDRGPSAGHSLDGSAPSPGVQEGTADIPLVTPEAQGMNEAAEGSQFLRLASTLCRTTGP